ncbi:gustatory receptor [Asbolus verrucosus]|uniref:Gustatory receptor n=1 Tax=Asbolus verrucosus TaxID=1661398 RepID=A0A482V8H3_ASBVE|nr:gustatory receptor [Asbolus verrucosus]
MCFIEEIPFWQRYIYKFVGILQFATSIPENAFSRAFSRLWCFPLYLLYYSLSVVSFLSQFEIIESVGIFTGIDMVTSTGSFFCVTISLIMFYWRSNQLRSLLIKVNEIKLVLVTSPSKQRTHDWLGSILVALIVLNFTLTPVFDDTIAAFLFYISTAIGSLDHLFLSNILGFVRSQFEAINQHLRRQIDTVDLSKLFPLTKVEKIKQLKEHEITLSIRRIQELSLLHCDLVNLVTEISGLFEITTITSMAMWFGFVINAIHYAVYIIGNMQEGETTFLYCMTLYVTFFSLWLYIMVRSFSRTQETANSTSTYVHDIWNKYDLNNKVDRRVRHLQLISIRLLNTKLKFTARNFFSLDWTFCHMMIAAVTTYVFTTSIPENAFSRAFPRLWCFPLYFLYYSIFVVTILTQFRDVESDIIFTRIDLVASTGSFFCVTISLIIFYWRSNQLRSLLTKVNEIKLVLVTSPSKQKSHDWLGTIFVALLVLNVALIPVLSNTITTFLFYCYTSPAICSLDHLFLSNILGFVRSQFEAVNQHLRRQIDAVDLSKLFPLTKVEKIKNLKEHEITFSIRRIQELSLLHYDLVNLVTEINGLFEITTITSMAMWFGFVIDAMSFTANSTSTYVHDIWNKYDLNNEVDRRVRHLQLISIRLLNTKLQFTARNFFNLDWTFCHTFSSQIPRTVLSKVFLRLWSLPLYFICYSTFSIWLASVCKILHSGEVLEGMDVVAIIVSIFSVTVFFIMFQRRNEQLESLLRKLCEIKKILSVSSSKRNNSVDWLGLFLIMTVASNFVLISIFGDSRKAFLFSCYISPLVGSLDHLFLSSILRLLRDQFEAINQNLQCQINVVDLFKIFPLTKAERIKNLKGHEVKFNIRRIQELSLLHYDLVNLASEINGLFGITTIASMTVWFGYVIDSIRHVVHVIVNEEEDEIVFVCCMGAHFTFFFLWLFIIVRSYSHTQETANRTSTYVHDIWNKYNLNNEIDRRVRHLQLISIRFLTTKLQFTAKNFFSLDWTLCHVMIAAVTTYVVILIQFRI